MPGSACWGVCFSLTTFVTGPHGIDQALGITQLASGLKLHKAFGIQLHTCSLRLQRKSTVGLLRAKMELPRGPKRRRRRRMPGARRGQPSTISLHLHTARRRVRSLDNTTRNFHRLNGIPLDKSEIILQVHIIE